MVLEAEDGGAALRILQCPDTLDRALIGSVEVMASAYGINLFVAIEKPISGLALEAAIHEHGVPRLHTGWANAAESTFPLEEIIAKHFEPPTLVVPDTWLPV